MRDVSDMFRDYTEDEFMAMLADYAKDAPEDCRLCLYQDGEVNKDYRDMKYYTFCKKSPSLVQVRLIANCELLKGGEE